MRILQALKFSEIELVDLLWAWMAISFAFAVVLGGGIAGLANGFVMTFILAGVTVGCAFLLHELAHKLVAQYYGYWAEFRKFNFGLMAAVAMSFLGFIFAAPGAVMISGFVSERENGIISAAGPLTNIALGILFYIAGIILAAVGVMTPLVQTIIFYGVIINGWLALFNMIPFPPLDGSKVISWSVPAWVAIVIISGFIAFGLV